MDQDTEMSNDRKEDEMICALTANEHEALRRGLRELPDTPPPRVVWDRIRAQAEAEGIIRRPFAARQATWYAAGLAAAVALVAFIAPNLVNDTETEFPTEPTTAQHSNDDMRQGLQALMVESRQLESNLRALPADPAVMRASTAATIAELEDRIAAIDYQLSDQSFQLSPENEELYWRERVRLMKSLLRLRYAQAQRTAF
jgi:hypothetical protein